MQNLKDTSGQNNNKLFRKCQKYDVHETTKAAAIKVKDMVKLLDLLNS